MSESFEMKIVRTGTWMYDGLVPISVDIIALNYDFWYHLDESDGVLEPDEKPLPLSEDGCLYYARFGRTLNPNHSGVPNTYGDPTIALAMTAAEEKFPGGLVWD